MFTGIVQAVGTLQSSPISRGSSQSAGVFWIETPWTDLALGESVAVLGVCLTVAEFDSIRREVVGFFISPETLARTHFESLSPGAPLNLERALLPSTRLSGHLVQGHVDGLGEILKVVPTQECFELTLKLPASLGRYCIPKGSLTVDGISLTLDSVRDEKVSDSTFVTLMIIPHTWEATHLRTAFQPKNLPRPVHLEVDVIAKYVERLCPNQL